MTPALREVARDMDERAVTIQDLADVLLYFYGDPGPVLEQLRRVSTRYAGAIAAIEAAQERQRATEEKRMGGALAVFR